MIFGKKYKITARKKEELEKELKELETKGRTEIADKLDWLRGQVFNGDDDPFADVLDEKNFLEKRIAEIKDVLNNCSVVGDDVNTDTVEIGNKVVVGFEGFEEVYTIVSSLEADPLKKKISDESPVGKALMGAKVGDTVEVRIGPVNKKFRILKIN